MAPGGSDNSGHGRRGNARVYCIVPRELAGKLHDRLRSHFAKTGSVTVVVERRTEDRRAEADRRADTEVPKDDRRRRIRNRGGRRIEDRRAPAATVVPPLPLPRWARRYAETLAFVERLEPASQHAEDVDTARLVTRFQAGEAEPFATIYMRYFDRLYTYLKVALDDPHRAEDASQQVFMKAFEALPRYERREQPFRAWLFTIARNVALQQLRKEGRVDLTGPEEMTRHSEKAAAPRPAASDADDLSMLGWVSDHDLVLFIERLPEPQRQALVLRYMMGFSNAEIAQILNRSHESVRMLQSRALSFLRQRLTALGRRPERHERIRCHGRIRQARVVRERRFVLR